jgi:hypothetical protein
MKPLEWLRRRLIIGVCAWFFALIVARGQTEVSPHLDSWLTPDELDAGWIALFDGKTLYGWQRESQVDWRVDAGTITASSGETGLLRTTTQFDQFELCLEFTAGPDTNSGVFVLTSPQPTHPAIDCYEINIVAPDRHEYATGALVARAVADFSPELTFGAWHSLRIVAAGEELSVDVDGRPVCRYRDPRPLGRGFIGLQFNGGPVAFRKIKLRPNQLESLFPNTDFEKTWNTEGLLDATTEVTADGHLRLTGGRGQLESQDQLGDFLLTLTARTPRNVNSGIFFRCIPGEILNGYECQIEHGVSMQGQPTDGGTGGIFRRQDARAVLSRPDEWFTLTIVANGPHFATWVNGIQTTDWRDERAADSNPRRGLRLERGTICIQGHDPETVIEFQKILVRKIDKRNR